jgi:hypothetical protein
MMIIIFHDKKLKSDLLFLFNFFIDFLKSKKYKTKIIKINKKIYNK